MNIMLDSADFLYDTGLLFEINRRILHPLGLELVLEYENKEMIIKGIGVTIDVEGIVYSEDAFKEGEEKFKNFMIMIGHEKYKDRKDILGFIFQKINGEIYGNFIDEEK